MWDYLCGLGWRFCGSCMGISIIILVVDGNGFGYLFVVGCFDF